jgi:phospholipid/cholesterol/gamma-HCH transport system substrate-binding protein
MSATGAVAERLSDYEADQVGAIAIWKTQPPNAIAEAFKRIALPGARLVEKVNHEELVRRAIEGAYTVCKRITKATPTPWAARAPPGRLRARTRRRPPDLRSRLLKASTSLDRINSVALAAEQGLGEVNAIAGSIRQGKGSLGKLVVEDDAYRKLVSLSDRGERTLNDVEENLAALKRTWPLSRYFNSRSFYDRDLVLFHPGATRESWTLREDELFEPDRSILTAQGRVKLDGVGAWFKKVKRPTSEVVIAAFTDDPRAPDLAQYLTQEQADTVRKYLIAKHAIDSTGWFSSRKIAAVGFGSEIPRTLADSGKGLPSRRVEIILFTPQA